MMFMRCVWLNRLMNRLQSDALSLLKLRARLSVRSYAAIRFRDLAEPVVAEIKVIGFCFSETSQGFG